MNLIIVHNEKKALSPKTKSRMGKLREGGTAVAQYIFCSQGYEARWFVWVFLHFFSWKQRKNPNQLDVALHMPDVTMSSNPFLGKELLHGVLDFERARVHCLLILLDTNKCWHQCDISLWKLEYRINPNKQCRSAALTGAGQCSCH